MGDDIRALATLVALGGGLRSNDQLVELGYRDRSFYMLIYEPKLDRYRMVCEEHDILWRELLKDEEVRRWFLEMIKLHDKELWLPWKHEFKWKISRDEWSFIASNVGRKVRKTSRRIYLAYQMVGQALVLGKYRGKLLILGIHIDRSNDEYYIA